MESGAHKKFISLYWITWIALLAAPVVSAWGSQTAGNAAAVSQNPQPPCDGQQCLYASARDQLVFQFIYHSEYAKKVEKFTDQQVQDELGSFCLGLTANQGKFNAAECKKTYLQTVAINLEGTRFEIHRMNDALARLHSGTVELPAPAALDAQGKPIAVQPRIPEPLELAEFQKVIAATADPKAQARYWEWVKSQPPKARPQRHHFPKLLQYTVTDRDGTKKDMVMIDRSCPEHEGSECYDLTQYAAALKTFDAKSPLDTTLALTHRNMETASQGMYTQPLKGRGNAYEQARSQVNAAVAKIQMGFDQADDKSAASAVRALASQPQSRKKTTTKTDINVFMNDKDMRSAIDSINF
jgi:hypothetical protein